MLPTGKYAQFYSLVWSLSGGNMDMSFIPYLGYPYPSVAGGFGPKLTIFLKSSTKVLIGTGTKTDPFILTQ